MNNIKPFNGIKSFSKNKDGVLTISEARQLPDDQKTEHHLMKKLKLADDGKLSREEFVKMMSKFKITKHQAII